MKDVKVCVVNLIIQTWLKNECSLCEVMKSQNVLGYRMATKILKLQRKSMFSENLMTENPENSPFVTQSSPNLIREGGRTVGSGRVATIIE